MPASRPPAPGPGPGAPGHPLPSAADVLARLAETLDVGALLRDVPGLSREGLQALLREAAAAVCRQDGVPQPGGAAGGGSRRPGVLAGAASLPGPRLPHGSPLLPGTQSLGPRGGRPGPQGQPGSAHRSAARGEAPAGERQPAEAPERRVRMHVDGSSRGNPGEAGAGVVFFGPDGRVLGKAGRYLGLATNNEAEYQALLLGLEVARARGLRRLEIVADSELLVRQLTGAYKVREPRLKALCDQALARLSGLDGYTIRHARRAENAEADAMANAAIDDRLRGLPDLVWYG